MGGVLTRGIRNGLFHLERKSKQRARPFVRTGRYRSSIKTGQVRQLRGDVGPTVNYSGWVEDGSGSDHAPSTHKNSSFTGHKTMRKTRDAEEDNVRRIVEKELRKVTTR
jgi:hypothetical protein